MAEIIELWPDAQADSEVLAAYAKWVFAGHNDDDAWDALTEEEQEILNWALIVEGDMSDIADHSGYICLTVPPDVAQRAVRHVLGESYG